MPVRFTGDDSAGEPSLGEKPRGPDPGKCRVGYARNSGNCWRRGSEQKGLNLDDTVPAASGPIGAGPSARPRRRVSEIAQFFWP